MRFLSVVPRRLTKEWTKNIMKVSIISDKAALENLAESGISGRDRVKTYVFKVVIEEDPFEDGRMAYHVFVPALPGCFSWGFTQEEGLENIQEVAKLWIEQLHKQGKEVSAEEDIDVIPSPAIAITL